MLKINVNVRENESTSLHDWFSSLAFFTAVIVFFFFLFVVSVQNWEWLRNAVLHGNANACISLTMQESAAV